MVVRSRHHLSPPVTTLFRKVVTAKKQTGSGFSSFRHTCHYLISMFGRKNNGYGRVPPKSPYAGTAEFVVKVVTGMTDSRKPSPDAGFCRHHLVFQVMTGGDGHDGFRP